MRENPASSFGLLRLTGARAGEPDSAPTLAPAPHILRIAGRRVALRIDRRLARWFKRAGLSVSELLARALAADKASPALARQLGGGEGAVRLLLVDHTSHLVDVTDQGGTIGLNRAALAATRLSARAALVAVGLVHGLRAAARAQAGEASDAAKERLQDVKSLLLLLVGIRGTEWKAGEIEDELKEVLDEREPLLGTFAEYAVRLQSSRRRRDATVLDDRVFRDGRLFDRLPGREKLRVIVAGTLAWYGLLTLGLLRLPRRWFAKRNPYYETAWWILRAKPGGRRMFKTALLRRGLDRLRSFRLLSAFEFIWSAWNPTLAVTCLRPVYRASGGNHRPFVATMAAFAYTALVIHPLWVTLLITGAAYGLEQVWPWLAENTRIASRENVILHVIVIGFWIGVGFVIATSKLIRSLER